MKKCLTMACILSVLVTAIMMAGCGSSGSSSKTPEEVAKTFFAAYGNRDADTVWSMLSANTRKEAGSEGQAELKKYLEEADSIAFTVEKVTVDGDKATARVTATISGDSSTENIPLLKEDGVWKVDMASSDKVTK